MHVSLSRLHNHTQKFATRLQELVELIFEAVPLDGDEPCALAAHLPPNLTILLLHYMPESSPRIDIPDEIQVRQRAHAVSASAAPATALLLTACCRVRTSC